MKLKIHSTHGTAGAEVELPEQFHEEIREDLIKKAVLAIQNNKRQLYAPKLSAGNRHSSWVSKRRRDWRGSYGHGISRVPRKVLSHRGTQFIWVGAMAPGTVGGRRAHPPKLNKIWDWKLNVKEKRKAIRSAISATVHKDIVKKRGHIVPDSYPFIVEDSFEQITKTSDLLEALTKLGFEKDLARASVTVLRSGKGKFRGRATKHKKSLLIVAHDSKKLMAAASNIPGVDVSSVRQLNAELLAPGTHHGRATLFTHKAIEELRKGLFTKNYSGESKKKAPVAKEVKEKKEVKSKTAKPAVKKTAAKKN